MGFKTGKDNCRKDLAVVEKGKQTCLRKYKVDNPMKDASICKRSRDKNTVVLLQRYGVQNISQVPEVKVKKWKTLQNTLMKKYGVDKLMNVPGVREKAYLAIRTRKPTSLEIRFGNLFPKLLYVGNGKKYFTVGDRKICPDFLVPPFEETNKVVEVFGTWVHKPGQDIARVEKFNSIGVECLVIWDYELKNLLEVIQKVKVFISSETVQEPLKLDYQI